MKTDCSIFVVSLVPKLCSIRNMYCILCFYFIFFNCIELDIEFFSMKTDCSIFVMSLVPKLCSIRNMYCILWFYFIFFLIVLNWISILFLCMHCSKMSTVVIWCGNWHMSVVGYARTDIWTFSLFSIWLGYWGIGMVLFFFSDIDA